VVPQEPEPPEPPAQAAQAAPPAECEATCVHHRPVRLSRAKLLKRVFEIDLENCPNCGGQLKIIAAIMKQPVIEKMFAHLGLQADCERMTAPARGSQLQAARPPLSIATRAAPSAGLRGPATSELRGAADRGLTARENPGVAATNDALQGCGRPSTGRSRHGVRTLATMAC